MLELEIDGKQIEVTEGSTIMDAANRLGIFIPYFCYHRKLSIAANCRMCLVQVEKAPKPLPACATPVSGGMKVFTHSDEAVNAQKGVMEFLLINHPLDCPICDQGGECPLQDLAVGYGGSSSRYQEEKRVVVNKNLGPLIATDMTRCIHCTRCVRFGQEIAGVMELGMVGRGEYVEIMPFVEKTVDSELSGNMIDICPVGALTSKPYRYTARAWELSRHKSVSPHDSFGSNLIVQVKENKVMRVLPRENEEINECWLSDRDRFSYEGLNSEERLTRPMLKQDGEWKEVEWQTALEYIANRIKQIKNSHSAQAIGALATAHSTLEELYLLQKLVRGLGSGNVDFRLRQSDFSADDARQGAPWLGMKIADLNSLDRVLVIGSALRKDHPLTAHRLRQTVKRGMQLNLINPADDELLMPVANRIIVAPGMMNRALAEVLKATVDARNSSYPAQLEEIQPSQEAKRIAESLLSGKNVAIFLGNIAQHHPQAAALHALAQELAMLTGAKFGFFGEAANRLGGYIAGAVPDNGAGKPAKAMLDNPLKAYLLLNAEVELDCHDPQQALAAMRSAELVVAMSAYTHQAVEYAHVLLPIAPFTETAGTFINTEGRAQSFNSTVKPLGETRPAWKVLRVLGNLLGLAGFEQESIEQVRVEVLPNGSVDPSRLNNGLRRLVSAGIEAPGSSGLQRIAEVPIYQADAIARRAASLQKTRDAAAPAAWLNGKLFERLGLREGDKVKLAQGRGIAVLIARRDDKLPENCVRAASAHPLTANLGAMFGEITVERCA
ncbi:MAG TPA: NADH-quinone oxidoreductase subunit NuoG [Burkholderiales bacterium]|nr:NADH-quinone oxidoreductase subunit NuoG [Burkholderiales bacterium]